MRNNRFGRIRGAVSAIAGAAMMVCASAAIAAEPPSVGITATTIKIGGICPSTGPIASFVTICAMQAAYFKYINKHDGGVLMGDGVRRKINYIYYDDGYSPPRTVEAARRLVELDHVALIIGPLGSATGLAIRPYLNQRGVPQLFVGSGLAAFSADSTKFPWTEGWEATYTTEGSIYADFVKSRIPGAKVAVLYQNDDFGKELLNAFKREGDSLGLHVVATQPYEVMSPTVDSQVTNLAASGAQVFLSFSVPKFTAQALRKIQDTSWRPMIIVDNISASKKAVMDPAGAKASEGVYSSLTQMDPTSPEFANTKDIKTYRRIGTEYGGAGLNLDDPITMIGFGQAQTMVAVLERAKAPTRKAIMESVRHLCGVQILGMLPGVNVCTNGKKKKFFIDSMQIVQFSKGGWNLVGKVITKDESKMAGDTY